MTLSDSVEASPSGVVSEGSAVLRIREVETAAGVPGGALIAVSGDAAGVLQHPSQVKHVPGREGGVAISEVVLRAAGTLVEIGRSGPGLADPTRVRLRRDRIAEVLQGVEDVHRAVLEPVLVAGHQ